MREGNGTDIDLTIELDNVTKDIDIMFVYRNRTTMRFIPFHIDFASGIEVFSSEWMGNDTLPRPIINGYIDLVAKAIQGRADEIRAREAKPSKNPVTVYQRTPPPGEEIIEFEDYQSPRQGPRVKTRPSIVAPDGTQTAATDKQPPAETLTQTQGRFTIGGLDFPTITSLLEAGGVEAVSPERILAKVTHHLEMANANNWPPGKHLILEQLDKRAMNLDLRQINWHIDGNQIRIILFGTGNGHYELCGIINKKGTNQQNSYLKQLIKRLKEGKIRPE